MKIINKLVPAAAALVMMAGSAYATPVYVDYQGSAGSTATRSFDVAGRTDELGSSDWDGQAGVGGRARGGPFNISTSDGSFIAWCIDVFQFVGDHTYDAVTTSTTLNGTQETFLSRLFTQSYDAAMGATADWDTRTAFQLAIWEIVYDENSLDVTSGDFRAAGNTTNNLANTYLSTLGSGATDYDFTFYESGTRQDLLVGNYNPGGPGGGNPSPVPLPAGVLLLGAGLGALGVARRMGKKA